MLASFLGGNIELILLSTALGGAWLLWHDRGLWAAPLIAFSVLCKPFYALLFVVVGLLRLANAPGERGRTPGALALTAGLALLLSGLEVLRWEPELRTAALAFVRETPEHLWFALPAAEQTPMSIWNRTPLQGLILLGASPRLAQGLVLGSWLVLLFVTCWWLWNRTIPFPLAFAFALVLLYLGRPVGWGLIYLEVVVVLAIWLVLDRTARAAVLAGALAVLVSHWWALVLSAQGRWLRLFTLQSAEFPWETWSVVPLCWLLLIAISRRLATAPAQARRGDGS